MRVSTLLTAVVTLGACLSQFSPALAQGVSISDAECQSLRQRLAEHARLSDGVRRAVTAQAGAAPAASPGSTPAPTGRAGAIRARLEQLPKDRQTLEDQRLVDRCLAGDRQAWSALVRRHERLVYAVARAYRLPESDLGDVFQEVFAALVRGLPRVREPRALVRWLSSTTQRIARATALRRRREAALTVGVDPQMMATYPGKEPAVGTDLERLEDQALLRLALAALPPRCRRLLETLYYEDPPPAYADVSRRLGLPVGSIGPTRARCFERLREAYARLTAEPPSISDGDAATFEPGAQGPRGVRRGSIGSVPEAGVAGREDYA